jgi:alanine racemase
MDLLMLDLRGVTARHGDEVTLWGGALPVDEVASHAGTIGYELLCSAGGRVMRHYHPARA